MSYPITTMLPPYAGQNSSCGVYLAGASKTGATNNAIPIGSSSNGLENIFDKVKTSIFVLNSNAAIQNNVFQNARNSINNSTSFTAGSGVLILNFFNSASGLNTTVGGTSAALKNTFYNNDYGVYNLGKSVLTCTYNRFDTQDNGVYVTINSNNSAVNISSNKFVNNTLGINLDQNSSITATISQNWMDNPTAQGLYSNNFAIRCTEAVLATTGNYPKYTVYNNYINGYYNGIRSALTYSASIKDNEVHMRPDNTGGHFQFGITANNTNNNEIANNLVDMPVGTANNWWQGGIFSDLNTVPKVHCNTIDYIGNGIVANSLNYTTAGNGFYGNSMAHAGYGFWLNANGEIGDQYYLTTANSADNTWTSCGNETYVSTSSNTLAAHFYTRSTGIYAITSPTFGGTGIPLTGIVSTASLGVCYSGIATPTLSFRLSGPSAQSLLMQKADEIANGNLSFTTNDVSLKHMARKQLYHHMALQDIDPAVTPGINGFMNMQRHLPIGKFYVIDSLINTCDSIKLNIANALNNNVSALTDVDVTQKQFNTLYLAYLKNKRTISNADVSALESIANLCPNAYGQAVHQARSVLFNMTKKQYMNACEFPVSTGKFRMAAPVTITELDISVYPNPAINELFVEAKAYEQVSIRLYNMMGALLLEETIPKSKSTDISQLPSGIYLYKIYGKGIELKIGKLIISK